MNDSVELVIKASTGESRKYTVRFPNVGEYYRIQCLKAELSKNTYGGLVTSLTQEAINALDMIDIEATLTVLVPQLISDMKVSKFAELGLVDYKIIKEAYLETIQPFMNEVKAVLNPA